MYSYGENWRTEGRKHLPFNRRVVTYDIHQPPLAQTEDGRVTIRNSSFNPGCPPLKRLMRTWFCPFLERKLCILTLEKIRKLLNLRTIRRPLQRFHRRLIVFRNAKKSPEKRLLLCVRYMYKGIISDYSWHRFISPPRDSLLSGWAYYPRKFHVRSVVLYYNRLRL